MRSTGSGRSTSSCSDGHEPSGAHGLVLEGRAQSTVEAAILIPLFLLLLLLAVQPVCLLYTRSVMESAAAATARLMITAEGEGDDAYRAFTLRRLGAVPDVSIFHAGGPLSWEIDLVRAEGAVTVAVAGRVRPLPVIGAFADVLGERNAQGDVRLRVEVSYAGRPAWLEGSYETWISAWDS